MLGMADKWGNEGGGVGTGVKGSAGVVGVVKVGSGEGVEESGKEE